jgi:hypothetical protein
MTEAGGDHAAMTGRRHVAGMVVVVVGACAPSAPTAVTDVSDDEHGDEHDEEEDDDDTASVGFIDNDPEDDDDDDGGDTAGDTGDADPPLFSGERFVDLFYRPEGIFVVHASGVEHLSRAGDSLVTYASDGTIDSVAWDSTYVVVSEATTFTIFDNHLAEVTTAPLEARCVASVVLGDHFVCGSEGFDEHVYTTYSMSDGTEVATSDLLSNEGAPMRAVPGFYEFITVSLGISPTDLHLFELSDQDVATFVNESPYHSDLTRERYAFWGDPATHVVTPRGLLLRIHGEGCSADVSSFRSGCFVMDGTISTLPRGSLAYRDLREAADGSIVGIVSSPDLSDGRCTDPPGCVVQRIDVGADEVLASATFIGHGYTYVRPDVESSTVAIIAADSAPFVLAEGTAFEVYTLDLAP